jgi:HEAT repeat protein
MISIHPWGNQEKYTFLKNFAKIWKSHQAFSEDQATDRDEIINSMLVVSDEFSSPLEFTLKTLAAYSGDITGPGAIRSIESYLKRNLLSISKEALRTMEVISLHMLTREKSSFSRKDLQKWLSEATGDQSYTLEDEKIAPFSAVIQTSLEQGILQQASSHDFYFRFPTIAGYFAARGLKRSSPDVIQRLIEGPDWSLLRETMRYFAAFNDIRPYLPIIARDPTLLRERMVRSGLWFGNFPPNSQTELELIKLLTREIQSNPIYLVKARLAAALARSKNPNIKNIFQHLLKAEHQDTRRVAAIGTGLIRDLSAVPALISQLNDLYPSSTTACYALGRIASPRSLEAIADALLHGDERLRRSAAESLALNRSEGHPALREGVQMDDLLVRYAVVHGLSLIKESWSLEILEKMRIDENEWVVRDLAQQLYEAHEEGSPYLPAPQPEPHQAPWLNKYASDQGLPEPNPQNSLDLLMYVLERGTGEQKQAALFYLAKIGTVEQIPILLQYIQNPDPDISQTALLDIWYCAPPSYQLSGAEG